MNAKSIKTINQPVTIPVDVSYTPINKHNFDFSLTSQYTSTGHLFLKNQTMFNIRTSSLGLSAAITMVASQVIGQSEFITTWQTANAGTTTSTKITIPTHRCSAYAYDVDRNNDETFDELGFSGDITQFFIKCSCHEKI